MLRPLTLPTAVLVSSPVLPVMPLRSTTSQAKNVRATTTISGLAALRKACIVEPRLRDLWGTKSPKLKPINTEPQGCATVSS